MGYVTESKLAVFPFERNFDSGEAQWTRQERNGKVVCIQYPTGKDVSRGGKTYPETKLLTVGSAFVDLESGRMNGTFHAVPPQWDGRFVILNPLPKAGDASDDQADSGKEVQ
jgi:hypothetical protein